MMNSYFDIIINLSIINYMTKDFDDELIAFVVGNGAGSKYIQSLLDGHPEIYMLPGYPLMYFYPHYKETSKIALDRKDFVSMILDRMPAIYDTTLMPGSETLNKLGKDGIQYLKVEKKVVLKYIMLYLNKKKFNSKNLLLAIHEAHFKFFGTKYYLKKPSKIFYHIHDHFHLKDLKNDFPRLKLISMARRPGLNIARRIRSSILEADSDKLDNLDFTVVKLQSSSKTAYYHYEFVKICSKLKIVPFFIKYDEFIKNESLVINSTLIKIGLLPIIGPLVPTFGGLLHKLRFYEKHRGTSLRKIRLKALQELNRPETNLDKIYNYHILRKKLNNSLIFNALIEILMPTSYEIDLLMNILSPKYILNIFNDLSKIIREKPIIYNMDHGYYIFKWSTPITIIKINTLLKQKQIQHQFSNNYLGDLFFKVLRLLNYFLLILGSYFLYPLHIFMRIILQIKIIYKIKMINRKN